MSRKFDRENLFKLIYDFCLTGERDDSLLDDIFESNKESDVKYISTVYDGIIENYNEIINEISNYAKGFTLDRIYKVDLAIIVLAVYEIKFLDDVPTSVAINEAVNLSKVYSTEKSGKYINGILKNFVK